MAGKVDIQFDGEKMRQVINQMEGGAVIAYGAEYAPYVEFPTSYQGTQPPFDPIFDWVDSKWPDLDSSLKTDQNGNDLSKRDVAWKVVYILSEYGTDGVHFGSRSLEQMRQNADAFAQKYDQSGDPDAARKLLEDIADFGFQRSQEIVADEATNKGQLLQSGQISITDDPTEVPD